MERENNKSYSLRHPQVARIWEHGGLAEIATNGKFIRSICILLKGSVDPIQFDDYGDGSAIQQAEEYLKNLK